MISDLTSTDCTGLFPFRIIVHIFVSTILQNVVNCMLVAAIVDFFLLLNSTKLKKFPLVFTSCLMGGGGGGGGGE